MVDRELQVRDGYIKNPETGRMVKIDGRIGQSIVRAHQAALIQNSLMLDIGTGNMRTSPAYVLENVWRTGAFNQHRLVLRGEPPRNDGEFMASIARSIKMFDRTNPNEYRQVIIRFEDENGNASTRVLHGKTSRELLEQYRSIGSGIPTNGSDVVIDNAQPVTSEFSIGTVTQESGAGLDFSGISKKSGMKHPHFLLTDFAAKSKDGDCLFAVLRAFRSAIGLPKETRQNTKIRQLLNLEDGAIKADSNIIDPIAKLFDIRIRIVSAVVMPPDNLREYDDENGNLCLTPPELQIQAIGGEDGKPMCDVFLADGHYQYIRRYLEPYPQDECTGDLISQPYTLDEKRRRVIEQGRPWRFSPQKHLKPKNTPWRDRVIVYDYETVYDNNGVLRAYALGFMIFDKDDDEDFSQRGGEVYQKIGDFKKHDASADLLNVLMTAPDDVRYLLVSFNGARFDHFLLAAAANSKNVLSAVFATSAGLRSMNIGRHKTLDLAKIITACSLDTACKNFKTQPKKLEGFAHSIPQRAAERGELTEWLKENINKVGDYLAKDVLSTASLLIKARKAIKEASGNDLLDYKDGAQTIGQIAWNMMDKTCLLPKAVEAEWLDKHIRSAIVGGRVQIFTKKGAQKVEQMKMVDVCSLYPTAMAAVPKAAAVFNKAYKWGFYPCIGESEPQAVKTYNLGDVGIWNVTIHHQGANAPNVLPRREENKPLDWAYKGEFDTIATHIDINLILENGGSLTIKEGYRWEDSREGLFAPFIIPLANLKDEQDRLKKTGNENAALRNVYKLLMNSASGKCCQANYDDEVILAKGSASQNAAEEKMNKDKPRLWIPLGGESCIIIGKKKDEKVYNYRYAKPSILSVLIYSYSRAYVWKTMCQHNIKYSDTDSGLFSLADYKNLRAQFPALDPCGREKELGDLDEELDADNIEPLARVYLIEPKDYAIYLVDKDGNYLRDKNGGLREGTKIKAKGVNQRTDRLILLEDEIAEMKQASGHIEEFTEEYYSTSFDKSITFTATAKTSSETVEEYIKRREPNDRALEQFFSKRAEKGAVSVLCSQLTRTFKDIGNPLSLSQRYLIKKL